MQPMRVTFGLPPYQNLVAQAKQAFDQQRWADAESLYKMAIQMQPQAFDPHAFLARIYTAQERWPEALQSWQQCTRLQPENAEAWLGQSKAQAALRDRAAALQSLDRAVQLAPDRLPVAFEYLKALLEAGERQRASDHALRLKQQLTGMAPDQLATLAATLGVLGRLLDAHQVLQEACERHPGGLPLTPEQARLFRLYHRFGLAPRRMCFSLGRHAQLQAWQAISANRFLDASRLFTQAERWLYRCTRYFPADDAARLYWAAALVDLNKTAKAIEQFEALFSRLPRLAGQLPHYGRALAVLERPQQALEAYLQYLETPRVQQDLQAFTWNDYYWISSLAESLDLTPDQRFRVANLYHSNRDMAGATRQMQLALQADPQRDDIRFALAQQYLAEDHKSSEDGHGRQQAVILLRDYLSRNPQQTQVWMQLGALYLDMGDPDKAVHAYVSAFSPYDFQQLTHLSEWNNNEWKAAREHYNRFLTAIHQAAPRADAYHLVARQKFGRYLANQQVLPEAINDERVAIASDPGFAPAHWLLGLMLVLTGAHDEGFAELGEAVRLDPHTLLYRLDWANQLLAARRYQACLEVAQGLNDEPARLWFSGLARLQLGDHAQAAADLELASQKLPGRHELAWAAGCAQLLSGNLAGYAACQSALSHGHDPFAPSPANVELGFMLALPSPNAELFQNIANRHLKAGRPSQAVSWLQPLEQASLLDEAGYMALVDACLVARQNEQAIETAESGLGRYPGSAHLVVTSATALAAAGQIEQAIRLLDTIPPPAPDQPFQLLRVAQVYLQAGQAESVLASLQELSLRQPSAEAQYLLGRAYIELAQHGQALELLQQAASRRQLAPAEKRLQAYALGCSGKPDEAHALYLAALGADPRFEWPAQQAQFLELCRARPASRLALWLQARLALDEQRLEDASQLTDAGAQAAPTESPLAGLPCALAEGWHKAGRPELTRAVIEAAYPAADTRPAACHYWLGRALLDLGERQAALEHLLQAIHLAPDAPGPAGAAPHARLEPALRSDVLAQLPGLAQDAELDVQERLRAATILIESGQSEAAQACCEQAIQAQPGDPAAWHIKVRAHIQTGEAGHALEALQRLKALDPWLADSLAAAHAWLWQAHDPAFFWRALTAGLRLGLQAPTGDQLQALLSLQPEAPPDALAWLGRWLWKESLAFQHRQANPQRPAPPTRLASDYLPQALACLQAASQSDPGLLEETLQLACLLGDAGQVGRLLEALQGQDGPQKAGQLAGATWAKLARLWLQHGDYPAVVAASLQAQRKSYDSLSLRVGLACALLLAGDLPAARQARDHIADWEPVRQQAQRHLAEAARLEKAGDPLAAARSYQQALSLPAEDISLYLRAGQSAIKAQEFSLAQHFYQAALQIDPFSLLAAAGFGVAAAQVGEHRQALEWLALSATHLAHDRALKPGGAQLAADPVWSQVLPCLEQAQEEAG